MLSLIGQILFGLVVGVIAKLLMPGRDPGGIVVTAIIGMVGALIGTLIVVPIATWILRSSRRGA